MRHIKKPWPQEIIRYLEDHPESVRTFILPTLLFLLDLTIRAVLGINLGDAGADMALLGVSSFASIVPSDVKERRQSPLVAFICFIGFMIPWIVCLWIISPHSPLLFHLFGIFDARSVLALPTGFLTLIVSSRLVDELMGG